MRYPFLPCMAAIALLVGPAVAQEKRRTWIQDGAGNQVEVTWGQADPLNLDHYKQRFTELDRNRDGVLSAGELPNGHALFQHWDNIDTDGDGSLSRDEFARWAAGQN